MSIYLEFLDIVEKSETYSNGVNELKAITTLYHPKIMLSLISVIHSTLVRYNCVSAP
jgi:hypothetical protein